MTIFVRIINTFIPRLFIEFVIVILPVLFRVFNISALVGMGESWQGKGSLNHYGLFKAEDGSTASLTTRTVELLNDRTGVCILNQ